MTLLEVLIDYSERVLEGEIIACQKHKWACQRFLRDVKRQGTEEFPYIFDEKKAIRFLKWMTYFKHSKGVLAGEYIDPHEIQIFIFGNIYGWVHKDTGYRRFKKAYWQVARKNAKSQSLALVGLYETIANDESASEVYCAATKRDQAKIVWKEAELMVRKCKPLEDKVEIKYGEIRHIKTNSFMKTLSKEDGQKGDGLNPQCGIIDEYHAHDTTEFYDIITSGMAARKQPLLMIITTAGFDINKPCYNVEYNYVSQILDPNNPVENDEYFVMINELDKDKEGNLIDDIRDEGCWIKANPILCSYKEGVNYLRGELKAALDVPEKMRNFLTKNMNVWVNAREHGYMDLNKWKLCGVEELPDLENRECYVGIDLSSKLDLTSVGFEFPMDDGSYVVLSHSFMPEGRLQEKINTDKIPYDLWHSQGWITLTDGDVVDYRYIQDYIVAQAEKNGWIIKEICYDPYNATQFANEMADEGYEMVEIRQGVKTLSEPTKNFRELVYSQKIIHDNNPVLTWAIGNAVTRQDHNGNIMLDKSKATQRIDPITAVINAHVRAMANEPKKKSVYEDHDILVL
jgi:phage terminase large subunit-like protein